MKIYELERAFRAGYEAGQRRDAHLTWQGAAGIVDPDGMWSTDEFNAWDEQLIQDTFKQWLESDKYFVYPVTAESIRKMRDLFKWYHMNTEVKEE